MTQRAQFKAMLVEQVRENGAMLYKVAFRVLHDSAAAEDACQQAFLKALQRSHQLREASAIRAWLTRMVVNEAITVLRKRQRERDMHQVRSQFEPSANAPLDQIELKESVLAALESLDEQTKAVVTLRLMHGLSGNQVKDMLDCSAAQVSRRLHEGIETLRPLLHEQAAVINR